jgi:uncharacterized protein YecE (DUF72 family)
MDAQLPLFDEADLPSDARRVGPAPVDDHLEAVARRLSPALRLGTSSWSFPGWEGIVYDRRASEATLAADGLGAYAAHPLLRTVGLDRTFYRTIGVDEFRAYAGAVPDHFRFVVKADRLLTSPLDPEPFGVRQPNPRFLDPVYAAEEVVGPMVEGLGAKAGPLLFQFPPIPPNLVGGRAAFLRRLHAFLERLPAGPRYSVELRTPAFLGDDYVRVLEATGATHCYNVHPAMAPLERQFEQIGPFYQPALVVRWMLHAGLQYEVAKDRYAPFDRIVDEDAPTRERLAVAALDALVAEREVFVVANNKAEGSAPLSVFAFAERIAAWTDQPLATEPPSTPEAPLAP